jgi:hypothetical protein
MKTISYFWNMLKPPRRTSRALLEESRVRYAAALVVSYGLFAGLGAPFSALRHDYPAPPDIMALWIKAWGEFAILPFLKIPPENYQAFVAVIMVPLALAFFQFFPPLEYTLLYGLGGVYNAIDTQTVERWAVWKSVVGGLTFAWPILLISVLLR